MLSHLLLSLCVDPLEGGSRTFKDPNSVMQNGQNRLLQLQLLWSFLSMFNLLLSSSHDRLYSDLSLHDSTPLSHL